MKKNVTTYGSFILMNVTYF